MENRTKVIILIQIHFNKRDYDRFGIEILIKNGFEVEVWEFTPFLTTEAYQKATPPDPITWNGHFIFKNKNEAISAISGLDRSAIIVSLLSYGFGSLAIYQAISKAKIFYCEQQVALPVGPTSSKQQLIKKIASFTIKKLCNRLVLMIPFKVLGVRPVDLRLISAEKFLGGSVPVNEKSKILWAHSFDYDLFLRSNTTPASVKENKGVFLDSYFPFHSDFAFMGTKSIIDPVEYYGALCRFFDHLEDKFGVKIIIAAHPRSHYEDMPDLFGGREVIRGKTIELVRDAGFVITHNSLAMNFAVLFNRPLIFLTSNKIIESYTKGLIEDPSVTWLASFFGKEAHNIDHAAKVDLKKELAINETAYRDYKNYYIKKDGSEELPYWQIFANYLKKEYVRNQ